MGRRVCSTELSWAASVMNLLCDYCRSETQEVYADGYYVTDHGGRDERANKGRTVRIETGVRKGHRAERKKYCCMGDGEE